MGHLEASATLSATEDGGYTTPEHSPMFRYSLRWKPVLGKLCQIRVKMSQVWGKWSQVRVKLSQVRVKLSQDRVKLSKLRSQVMSSSR